MEKDKQVKDREFLLNLESCFEEAFSDDSELDRLLIHQGYNPKEDTEEGLKFIRNLLFERKLSRARSKREKINSLLQRVSDKYKSIKSIDIDSLLDSVFTGSGKLSIQAHFREFQSLDEEDKRGILEDNELLNEISEILEEDDE